MDKTTFQIRPNIVCSSCGVILDWELRKTQWIVIHKDPNGKSFEDCKILGSACPDVGEYLAPTVDLQQIPFWLSKRTGGNQS